MASPPPPESRRTAAPRAVGVLNLIVGAFLALAGSGFAYFFLPFLLEPVDAELVIDEMRRSTLARLHDDAAATSDPAKKAVIEAMRVDLESKRGKLGEEVNFDTINAGFHALGHYFWADLLTAPLLNILLGISGLGLLACKEWSRKLAIFVAAAKVVRLGLLSLILLAVVVPMMGAAFKTFAGSKVVDSLIRVQIATVTATNGLQVELDAKEVAEILVAIGYGFAITSFFLGIIYPAVILIVLTRPATRAACSASSSDQV